MLDFHKLRGFSNDFDDEFAIGPEEGNRAYFGRNVLRGLVEGIDDFIHQRQTRWDRFRSLGPAMLGTAMWINDPEVIEKVAQLSAACIVVTKQDLHGVKLNRLHALNKRTPGMPIGAFAELAGLAPRVDGEPPVIGPYGPMDSTVVPTLRTIGYRQAPQGYGPIIHAKLALLGHLWWHDEGPLGHLDDVIGFAPYRLWISSANFTRASRRSLEFGFWTEDPDLIEGAREFLVKLMGASEALDPESDVLAPELAPVEFDHDAMAQALAESAWDEDDDPLEYDG